MPTGGRIPAILRPLVEGDFPNERGEWGMHCPYHNDSKRSASINFEKGKWYCNACAIGGGVDELVSDLERRGKQVAWFEDETEVYKQAESKQSAPLPSEGSVAGWHSALMANQEIYDEFESKRGLDADTLVRFQVGWDADTATYTLPIRDVDGQLVNVRHYDLHPKDERRKIWGVFGHNEPVLFPMEELEHDELIICEGEWDALTLIQQGFHAITRTGAARVWKNSWSGYFDGKRVWVCHDMDTAGQVANRKVSQALEKYAQFTNEIKLPYKSGEKNGEDVTDYFWRDGHEADEFKRLMKEAMGDTPPGPDDYTDITVLDSFGASAFGKTLRLRVTVTGKRNPTFLLPDEVQYTCTMDAGLKCANCPLLAMEGRQTRIIKPSDPVLLEMMGSANKAVADMLREAVGAPKCGKLTINSAKLQSVEELFVRPSVEIARIESPGQAGDHQYRKIISAGRHDTTANSTVEVVGAVYPNPRSQHNELLAWQVEPTETSIDKFEMTPEVMKYLRKFQVRTGQRPLNKIGEIANDLAAHVTNIYGRREMHAAMDLVWHSPLSFTFDGSFLGRGWLELLVVGDTRTGKSEVASRLLQHYRAGELVTCESATFAGVVGGLQQLASGREWQVTWGTVPINDRRLVVLDEVAGLTTEQIAQMSSIRSSGEAQLTKIRSERTWARTRLVWLGNPRNGRMSDYTYGVQAIRPLIGNNEDIARFDLAMSVKADEVDSEAINQHRGEEAKRPRYDTDSCAALIQWAWSRMPDHIQWQAGAEAAVFKAAVDMGARYVEDPPLVQAANVRVKISRVAVAMAMRTFSTDETGENVLVSTVHVEDAVRFMDMLYGMPGFGYKEHSGELLRELAEAANFYNEAKEYLHLKRGLAKFLRMCMGRFRSQDMQDMLNLDKDEASAIINHLWDLRMITRRGPEIRIQPLLHELLREFKER